MINNNKLIKPFVKWAGGKRQLLAELTQYIPKDYNKGPIFRSIPWRRCFIISFITEKCGCW